MVKPSSSPLHATLPQRPPPPAPPPLWQFDVPMAPGSVNVLDDILGEGEGLDFDATLPRAGGPER